LAAACRTAPVRGQSLHQKQPQKRRNARRGRLARGGWGGGSRFLSASLESSPSLEGV